MSSLPNEIWVTIFQQLDFYTLHRRCVLVSKGWFDLIRGTKSLSNELAIDLKDMPHQGREINRFLEKSWPKLKYLNLIFPAE